MNFDFSTMKKLLDVAHGKLINIIGRHGTQRAKIAEKVHKPPLGINVISFEFNGFNAFI